MNEEKIEQFEADITAIKAKNGRVEADKAWEASGFRIFTIAIITYIIASLVMFVIGAKNPFLNAFIPTLGFFLSTQSLPLVKKWWLKKYLNK